jgi:hypothetical protein
MTTKISGSTPIPGGFGKLSVTRRTLLAGTAALLAAVASTPEALAQTASAQASVAGFHEVSRAITGKADLSPTTSERIYRALAADHADLAENVNVLATLASANPTPSAFRDAAKQAGQGDLLLAILTAWYTGTVETKQGPVVVSYKEALMYRPVEDGLTVPTYCNKGPIWWTGLPPEVTRMPINNPKVL